MKVKEKTDCIESGTSGDGKGRAAAEQTGVWQRGKEAKMKKGNVQEAKYDEGALYRGSCRLVEQDGSWSFKKLGDRKDMEEQERSH